MNMQDNLSPWHEGERALQQRAGVAERMAGAGQRVIRPFMPEQHRQFFEQLPFVVVASLDEAEMPWASLLFGRPGFIRSPDPQRLEIAAAPMAGDPLAAAIRLGAPLGLLGIELPTRRRNRANGRVVEVGEGNFSLLVEQSFGNCAQYIQRRDYAREHACRTLRVEPIEFPNGEARDLILRADTCFVASAGDGTSSQAKYGLDASHRGGRPGFLRVGRDGSITVPEFSGNRFFNTLGNFMLKPHAGLLFADFVSGDLLQLTGTTEILDSRDCHGIAGAELLWRFQPVRGQWLREALPMKFAFRDFSPRSLATGTWQEGSSLLAGG